MKKNTDKEMRLQRILDQREEQILKLRSKVRVCGLPTNRKEASGDAMWEKLSEERRARPTWYCCVWHSKEYNFFHLFKEAMRCFLVEVCHNEIYGLSL